MSKKITFPGLHNLDSVDQYQTIEIDPCTKERRHRNHSELWELGSGNPQTILEGFEQGIKQATEDGDFIGIPQVDIYTNDVMGYEYRKYGQARDDARKFALYLQEEGMRPGTGFYGVRQISIIMSDLVNESMIRQGHSWFIFDKHLRI